MAPFWKGFYSKGKEFAPKGREFVPFTVDPFSELTWCTGKQTECHKICLPCEKRRKQYQVDSVTLGKMQTACASAMTQSDQEILYSTRYSLLYLLIL